MRNHLHGAAQIFPVPLLVQDVPVHLSRGEIGIAIQILIDKALVMAQVQVRLRAVLRDEHLAVLIRTHGSRIDIDVRIQFLGGHLVPPGLQQPPQRRRRNALSKSGNNASGYKNVLFHHALPFFPRAPRVPKKNFQKIKKIRFFRPESDEEPRSRFIATFSKIPYIRANIFKNNTQLLYQNSAALAIVFRPVILFFQ